MKFPARFSIADLFDGLESPVSPGCDIGIRLTIIVGSGRRSLCNVEKIDRSDRYNFRSGIAKLIQLNLCCSILNL